MLTEDLWLFGYGSLIWKADFVFSERRVASLKGWQRRFWQGSHDHRGTAERPGRVVTLIKEPDSHCVGMAYRIAAEQVPSVLEHLDFREKNGYERLDATVSLHASKNSELPSQQTIALVYIATPDNFAHLGWASDEEIARQITESVGPSGSNTEYLFELHRALAALGAQDAHVERLVKLVQQNLEALR